MLYELRTLVRGAGPGPAAAILTAGSAGSFPTKAARWGKTAVFRPTTPAPPGRPHEAKGGAAPEPS